MKNPLSALILVSSVAVAIGFVASRAPSEAASPAAAVARGEYLVRTMGCWDCHTPHVMGPEGPEPDESRWLSGHPDTLALPPAPELPDGPWSATLTSTMTAWSGPWGTSFTANLTPDEETGLGSWSFEQFREAVKTGRHQGRGRPILPPMPWMNVATLTDDDLAALWAYLRSIPPVRNRVPEPLPPAH